MHTKRTQPVRRTDATGLISKIVRTYVRVPVRANQRSRHCYHRHCHCRHYRRPVMSRREVMVLAEAVSGVNDEDKTNKFLV